LSISAELRERVRRQAEDRCGYCLCSQQYMPGPLEIDHIRPSSRGGTDDEDNLWLACTTCNRFKGAQESGHDPVTQVDVHLYNPRKQDWNSHFVWSIDGAYIIGLTPCGRATIDALQLNNSNAVMVRSAWMSVGWHPPALLPRSHESP
jgi:hypothetical protein